MKGASAVLAACLIAGSFASAQTQQQAPAPSPQQQLMGYFAGDWTLSGTTRIGPNTSGAPFTETQHGEWVPGEFFLEIHSVMKGPMGNIHGVKMLEYNPVDKVYTFNAYNSLGEHQMAVGKIQGNTWTWNSEQKMNGVITKGRYTVTATSANAYTFKSEVAKPGGGWSTVMEGKASRAAAQ